jgi:hypothetical protein
MPERDTRALYTRRAVLAGVAGAGTLAIGEVVRRRYFSSHTAEPAPTILPSPSTSKEVEPTSGRWEFGCIDTMKQSRDGARNFLRDPQREEKIAQEVKAIQELGASHIAVDTPYDAEFFPILENYVQEARKNKLNVFFRGNFSSLEYQDREKDPKTGWFDYPHEPDHTKYLSLTENFIKQRSNLFEDGDIFDVWPERENAFPSKFDNPAAYEAFLLQSRNTCKDAFAKLNKNIRCVGSMNGYIATHLSPATVRGLDNIVVPDHYVKQATDMGNLLEELRNLYGADVQVILGEFGAPHETLNGPMTEQQQSAFVEELFRQIEQSPNVIGVNYWVDRGGSTALFNENGSPREVAEVVKKYYTKNVKKK